MVGWVCVGVLGLVVVVVVVVVVAARVMMRVVDVVEQQFAILHGLVVA